MQLWGEVLGFVVVFFVGDCGDWVVCLYGDLCDGRRGVCGRCC